MAPLGVCFPTTSCCHNDALLFVFASLEKTPSSSCTKRATLDQLVFDDWSLRRSPWVTIIPMIIYTLLSTLTLYIELDNGIKLVESVLWDSVLRVLIIFPPPKIYGEMYNVLKQRSHYGTIGFVHAVGHCKQLHPIYRERLRIIARRQRQWRRANIYQNARRIYIYYSIIDNTRTATEIHRRLYICFSPIIVIAKPNSAAFIAGVISWKKSRKTFIG